jgi:hypothetical protein
MTRSLPPASPRLVGWLLLTSGLMLALGLLLRLVVAVYLWGAGYAEELPVGQLLLNLLALVGAGLLVRYGRRLLRGGNVTHGPDGKTIL